MARASLSRMTTLTRALGLSLLLIAALAAGPRAERRIVTVHIVSRAGDTAVPTDRPKHALASDRVTLYAVLAVREAGRLQYYGNVPSAVIAGRPRTLQPLDRAPDALLSWYKVEPRVESMSNTQSGSFQFEPIDYAETPVPNWQLAAEVIADVSPTLTPNRGNGLGTMRYKLIALTASGAISTPGAEARQGRGSGGLSDDVHRVSLRRDDSYLGYLTEMYGQPYIWASAGLTDARHQSERLEGSDCADFVVYGRRRMGEPIPYTWTGGLPKYTRRLARAMPRQDGTYVDQDGRPIAFPQPGDLVLFPRHVGVLTSDRGIPGRLDHQDVMFHSYFASPREQSLGDSAYANTWIEVRQWQ